MPVSFVEVVSIYNRVYDRGKVLVCASFRSRLRSSFYVYCTSLIHCFVLVCIHWDEVFFAYTTIRNKLFIPALQKYDIKWISQNGRWNYETPVSCQACLHIRQYKITAWPVYCRYLLARLIKISMTQYLIPCVKLTISRSVYFSSSYQTLTVNVSLDCF